MAKLLIVEDEEGFRRQLEIGLSSLGHEIRCASSGREAVDVGVHYRPDVLVCDWMLKDDIHGLHVVQVLQAVLPDLRAILITGFASADLRENAGSADALEFIEKPFTLVRIRQAVEDAASRLGGGHRRARLAAVEIGAQGEIIFANDRAMHLFAETWAGITAERLSDFFSPGVELDLDGALDRWSVVRPLADRSIAWHIRAQEPGSDGTRLLILRRGDDPQYMGVPIIDMLLGSISPGHLSWPFDGRVLIVEREPATRKWLVSVIENAGAGCYAVESASQAMRLLANDDGLQFVVLDYDTLSDDLERVIREFRSARPDVVIVGNSPLDHRESFARLDVNLFLQRPWRVNDLVDLLTGRIGNCVKCGAPLPLRRPGPGEHGESWICQTCGADYSAVLDDDASADSIANVRQRKHGPED